MTAQPRAIARRRPSDVLLALEALLFLAAARAAIAFLPFRTVGRLASRDVRRRAAAAQDVAALAARIRWAIGGWSKRVPWRSLCFEQGLATHLMLRRRGIPSVLFYGVAPMIEQDVGAHVWVRVGALDIIGADNASDFATLATFPPGAA